MASISPAGERAILALLAAQYDEIVELRIALQAERGERSRLASLLEEAAEDAQVGPSPAEPS